MAVVGQGTGEVLKAAGIEPAFAPSKAYGKLMGAELPRTPGERHPQGHLYHAQ